MDLNNLTAETATATTPAAPAAAPETNPLPDASIAEAFDAWKKNKDASTPDGDKSLPEDKAKADTEDAVSEDENKKEGNEDDLLEDHIKIRKQKKRLKKWEASLNEREARVKNVEELMTLWEKDPYEFLDKAKIDPRKWAERALAEPEDEAAKVRKELEEYKRQQEEARLKAEEDRQISRAINTVEAEVQDQVKSRALLNISLEDGEMSQRQLSELVWNDMVLYYQEYNEPIEVSKLLDLYEQQLSQQVEAAARKRERLNKNSVATPVVAPASRGSVSSEKRETKTLSNRDASSRSVGDTRPKSIEEIDAELMKKHLSKYMK